MHAQIQRLFKASLWFALGLCAAVILFKPQLPYSTYSSWHGAIELPRQFSRLPLPGRIDTRYIKPKPAINNQLLSEHTSAKQSLFSGRKLISPRAIGNAGVTYVNSSVTSMISFGWRLRDLGFKPLLALIKIKSRLLFSKQQGLTSKISNPENSISLHSASSYLLALVASLMVSTLVVKLFSGFLKFREK